MSAQPSIGTMKSASMELIDERERHFR